MIVSVSRRTDIPAYFSNWFYNRVQEGFCYVRNPMNYHRISKIQLNPEVVDCFVFISKNPGPMLEGLDRIREYPYYFHFTLNPYDKPIERNVPDKKDLVRTFQALSDRIGKEKVIWRYDPVLFCQGYTMAYHIENFEKLASLLCGYTNKCIMSFLDMYQSTLKNMDHLHVRSITQEEMYELAESFSAIARKHGLVLETCAEEIDLSQYGIYQGKCVDDQMIKEITGKEMKFEKDKQRPFCRCVKSVDIGTYQTCLHQCLYCYAVKNHGSAVKNYAQHDPRSPLLFGSIEPGDIICEKEMKSLANGQISLFG